MTALPVGQPLELAFPSPTKITVTGPEDLVREWWESLRVDVPGAEHTLQYKRHKWDGTYTPGKCMPVPPRWQFRGSRGLLHRAVRDLGLAPSNSVTQYLPLVEEWLRTNQFMAPGVARDFQQAMLRAGLTEGWGRAALATNAGKGAIIAQLANFARVHQVRALVLCDEVAPFDALEGELREWAGIVPGKITRGVDTPPPHPVVLAMVPTLAARVDHRIQCVYCKKSLDSQGECPQHGIVYTFTDWKRVQQEKHVADSKWRDWLRGTGMVLLDEADKASADTWRDVLGYCENSWWRVGFSGTFPSTDEAYADLRMDELMGPVLVSEKNAALVARGISAKPLVELHSFDITTTLYNLPRQFFDLAPPQKRQLVYECGVVHNVLRHQYIASLIRPDTPTALVVNRVDHGEALAQFVPGSVFIDGSDSPTVRRKILEQFQRGAIKVIIVTKILDRGTNRLGSAADLLFVSGEGSTRQTLQRIGRGLRRAGGKEFLRLVDIIDRVSFPEQSPKFRHRIAGYFHNAGRKRLDLYRGEQFEITIKKAGV